MMHYEAFVDQNRFLPPGGIRVTALITFARPRGGHSEFDQPLGAPRMRIWTPQAAAVVSLEQLGPDARVLSETRTPVSEQVGEYPAGEWPDPRREYLLRIDVEAHDVGDEIRAGRVQLIDVSSDEVVGEAQVFAEWTDKEDLAMRIDPVVADRTGQTELADAIRAGIEARMDGDEDTASINLTRAWKLAEDSGNRALVSQLAQVVRSPDHSGATMQVKPANPGRDHQGDFDEHSAQTAQTRKPS